jgi:hypothetical protein
LLRSEAEDTNNAICVTVSFPSPPSLRPPFIYARPVSLPVLAQRPAGFPFPSQLCHGQSACPSWRSGLQLDPSLPRVASQPARPGAAARRSLSCMHRSMRIRSPPSVPLHSLPLTSFPCCSSQATVAGHDRDGRPGPDVGTWRTRDHDPQPPRRRGSRATSLAPSRTWKVGVLRPDLFWKSRSHEAAGGCDAIWAIEGQKSSASATRSSI